MSGAIALASKDVKHVCACGSNSCQVQRVWRTLTFLVVELSELLYPTDHAELFLADAKPFALFPESAFDTQKYNSKTVDGYSNE